MFKIMGSDAVMSNEQAGFPFGQKKFKRRDYLVCPV